MFSGWRLQIAGLRFSILILKLLQQLLSLSLLGLLDHSLVSGEIDASRQFPLLGKSAPIKLRCRRRLGKAVRIQSFLCIAVENELLSVILRRFAVPLFLPRTKFALEEDYDNFPNPIRQGANGPSVTKFLPLAYSFPQEREVQCALCQYSARECSSSLRLFY